MRRQVAALAAGVLLAGGCTSEHGALPPPTAMPTSTPTEPAVDGVAAQVLLTTSELPTGFAATDIDPTERWAEAMDVTSALMPLRPGCADDLDQITATLSAVPPDAAGVVFRDEDGREIVQFAGVATAEAGTALIEQIADLNSRCDAHTLQVPERGSLALSVEQIDMTDLAESAADSGDVSATGWQTTILSDHLRWTQRYVAISVDGVVSFLAFTGGDITGELPLPEDQLAAVVEAAVDRIGGLS
jgi:hypothetical protein